MIKVMHDIGQADKMVRKPGLFSPSHKNYLKRNGVNGKNYESGKLMEEPYGILTRVDKIYKLMWRGIGILDRVYQRHIQKIG